jgi:uncharacterized membrane protein YcaP (DUF421 family)
MGPDALFDSWSGLLRVLVVGIAAYTALVMLLRITGKRTLSKLNAFDLVVTVALGSTLASILTSKSVALAEGVAALALLILLQLVVTWLSVRAPWFGRVIKAEPTLLLRNGEPLQDAMRRERITEDEVLSAIRAAGGSGFDEAEAVVLETDGSLAAILKR